jgi:hypothetical protein
MRKPEGRLYWLNVKSDGNQPNSTTLHRSKVAAAAELLLGSFTSGFNVQVAPIRKALFIWFYSF